MASWNENPMDVSTCGNASFDCRIPGCIHVSRHPDFIAIQTTATYGIGDTGAVSRCFSRSSITKEASTVKQEIAADYDSLCEILSDVYNVAIQVCENLDAFHGIELA